jgi:hypothetical protein
MLHGKEVKLTEKLIFTVADAKMVDENPYSNFAVLDLDFFASGENLHNMYVSEETLMKTAWSIKNCPLVWVYDTTLDDIGTHNEDEVPCGFVPETSTVKTKKLDDGRTMLSIIAYVWKRYTGEILDFFKRDGSKKPVSVEMSVYDKRRLPNGLTELLDFKYEAITVLGSFVTPAIPNASARVLSFSDIKEEYNKVLLEEFPSAEVIPESVKENAENGLSLRKKYNKGGTASSLSFAKYLIENEKASPETIREIAKYFSSHKKDAFTKDTPPENIEWLLWGGTAGKEWAESIADRLEKKEEEQMSQILTFPYKSMKDVNPSLKGIEPPISLGQANEIAKQADAIGSDDKKNGWAIAISAFKKSHTVENGQWVKKQAMADAEESFAQEDLDKEEAQIKMGLNEPTKEEITVNGKNELEEMAEKPIEGSPVEEKTESPVEKEAVVEEMAVAPAEDSPAEEKKETPAEEEKEAPAEEKKEEEKGVEKKFEFPKNFNLETMGQMFADEEDEDVKMAKEEMAKEFCEPGIIMGGMYAKMCKMFEAMSKMEEEKKTYMAENEELKKFKESRESVDKEFEVDKTLKEMSAKVVIPEEEMSVMRSEAEKYAFAELEQWKMYCKAKSFDFAAKEDSEKDVKKIGLHWTSGKPKPNNDVWAGVK